MFCLSCGKHIEDDAKRCPYCNAPTNFSEYNNQNTVNRTVNTPTPPPVSNQNKYGVFGDPSLPAYQRVPGIFWKILMVAYCLIPLLGTAVCGVCMFFANRGKFRDVSPSFGKTTFIINIVVTVLMAIFLAVAL